MSELETKIKSLRAKKANILGQVKKQATELASGFKEAINGCQQPQAETMNHLAASYLSKQRNVIKPLKDQAEDYQRAIDLLR